MEECWRNIAKLRRLTTLTGVYLQRDYKTDPIGSTLAICICVYANFWVILSIARNARVSGVARYKSPRCPIFLQHATIRINAHANSRLFSNPSTLRAIDTRAANRISETPREDTLARLTSRRRRSSSRRLVSSFLRQFNASISEGKEGRLACIHSSLTLSLLRTTIIALHKTYRSI